jgi:tripartite ATP-independent transporter DctM subunit
VSGLGLWLLLGTAVGLIATGLPAFLILIIMALVGGLAGWLGGAIPLALFAALPGRLVNLFENDLLQALPLFVFMGVLLDRLPLASALYRSALALMPGARAAPLVAGMGLGALLGPMNGSVGASVLALSRAVAPRLRAAGLPAPLTQAVIAVASTLGVVVPPSLVLILLGDAMLTAHTIALNATGRTERIINTQDVLRGVLLPAAMVLTLTLAVAWWQGRSQPAAPARERPSRGERAMAAIALLTLLTLLGGVAAGYFYAVEAAAMGAFLLLVVALAFRLLNGEALRAVLSDTMATTGALFALLLAATTLTLVLRMLGTDRLVADLLTGLPGGEGVALGAVLGLIGLSALVLDAFEIIFVIIPIVAPPLLMRVNDPVWAAVAILLVLQTSFLLPPMGYALMMTRGLARETPRLSDTVSALRPYLLAQILVLVAVLAVPALVHVGETPDSRSRGPQASDEDVAKRFNSMIAPPDEPAPLRLD